MKRTKSPMKATGKGKNARPAFKKSFSKSSSPESRGRKKPYGSVRTENAGSERKSFDSKPAAPKRDFKSKEVFDKGEFKRVPSKSAGRSFSKPRSNGDRPVRFKKEGDFTEKKNFSSSDRGGERGVRFKSRGDKPERGNFKRSFDKPAGGTYLRRKDDRPVERRSESRDNERPKFSKPDGERNLPASREERTPFRPERSYDKSESFPDKKKRKRIGDEKKPFIRKDKESSGKYNSNSSAPKSNSPRSFGEKRFEKKPVRDKKERGGYVRRPTTDRPERPWNRKEKHEFYGDRKKKTPEFLKASEDGSIRLNKYIANAGICSRREADDLITAGVVSVNGEVITELGYKVMPTDAVKYNNELLRGERLVYILLNKPKDFITTTDDPEDRKTVMNLIAKACKERVYPVGRLDRNTTGVLLFTNDGDLAKKLTHPSFEVHKIYQVELDRALKSSDMDIISEGVKLDDGNIKPDEVVFAGADKKTIGMELHSGKNRIVRRIFEHLGYEVKKLDRVVFAGLTKKDVPRGRWRFLTEMEVANLKMMMGKTGVKAKVRS